MKKEFCAPIEVVLHARIKSRRLFILIYGAKRVIELLINITEKSVLFWFLSACEHLPRLLSRTRQVSIRAIRQCEFVAIRKRIRMHAASRFEHLDCFAISLRPQIEICLLLFCLVAVWISSKRG